MRRVECQKEDVVAADGPACGLTAPATGKCAGPQLEDQRQAKALVGLGAA